MVRVDHPLEIGQLCILDGFSTLNHAAYIAGKASSVKTVATIKPPMIATAIGPQNTLRVSGIMANTAAEAALYPSGPILPAREGAVLRDPSGATWVVSGGKRVRAAARRGISAL